MARALIMPLAQALSGCLMPSEDPPVRSNAPDFQEGCPGTTVVTLHEWTDGDSIWRADILRETMDASGDISVFGSGSVRLAQFYTAKACIAEAGRFETSVVPVVKELPGAGVTSLFHPASAEGAPARLAEVAMAVCQSEGRIFDSSAFVRREHADQVRSFVEACL